MGNQKVREKKKPTFFLAVLPILAMILLLGVGYAVMGLSPEVLMLVSASLLSRWDIHGMISWILLLVNFQKQCRQYLF